MKWKEQETKNIIAKECEIDEMANKNEKKIGLLAI
jgi:hypothetical protein